MKTFLPALALAIAGTFSIAAMALAPRQGDSVAVIFPPGMTHGEMLRRVTDAGWLPIAYLNGSGMLAAPSEDSGSLLAEGALLVLDAAGARGCSLLRV